MGWKCSLKNNCIRSCFVNIVVMWVDRAHSWECDCRCKRAYRQRNWERLEMMWCQHGCHSGKEQEVYNAVRTTHCATETIDTPFAPKDSQAFWCDQWSLSTKIVSSMRRETDHLWVPSLSHDDRPHSDGEWRLCEDQVKPLWRKKPALPTLLAECENAHLSCLVGKFYSELVCVCLSFLAKWFRNAASIVDRDGNCHFGDVAHGPLFSRLLHENVRSLQFSYQKTPRPATFLLGHHLLTFCFWERRHAGHRLAKPAEKVVFQLPNLTDRCS